MGIDSGSGPDHPAPAGQRGHLLKSSAQLNTKPQILYKAFIYRRLGHALRTRCRRGVTHWAPHAWPLVYSTCNVSSGNTLLYPAIYIVPYTPVTSKAAHHTVHHYDYSIRHDMTPRDPHTDGWALVCGAHVLGAGS